MLEEALKLLKEFKDNGYKAYIVGGYVRDHILGIESSDVDITTKAKPKEVLEIEKPKTFAQKFEEKNHKN